jgi:hypothetical protein
MSFSASLYNLRAEVIKHNDGDIHILLGSFSGEHCMSLDKALALQTILRLAIKKAEYEIKKSVELTGMPEGARCSTCGHLVTPDNKCPVETHQFLHEQAGHPFCYKCVQPLCNKE